MIDLRKCAIVFDDTAPLDEHSVATYFYKRVSEYCPETLYHSDAVPEKDYPEILIGNTTRFQSVAALETLRRHAGFVRDEDFLAGNLDALKGLGATYNINSNRKYTNDADFIIRNVDKYIAITGTNPRSMRQAVDFFISQFYEKGIYEVPDDYTYYNTPILCHINVAGKPIREFKIVLPRDSSFMVRREAEKLRDLIQDTVGKRILIVDNSCTENMYEILIGETNRKESVIPEDREEFYVKWDNRKVVICGGHTYSTASAVKEFIKYLSENASGEEFDIPSTFTICGRYQKDGTDYNLVFADEFDGDKLDTTIWSHKTHKTPAHDGGYYYRTPDNVRVENGQVILTAKPEDYPNYSSSYIYTPRTVEYIYGYAEIHAKLPKGYGIWPAFWMEMNNQQHYQEIDCLELFSNDSSTIYSTTHDWYREVDENGNWGQLNHLYCPTLYKGVKNFYHLDNGETFNDAYHTFGVEWTAEEIKFYCDGNMYYSTSIVGEEHDIHRTAVYLIMCIQVAQRGSARKPDETTPWPAEYNVDWIHLYQKPNYGYLKLEPKTEE